MEFDLHSWVVIPLLIFFARIADVTLGTLRFKFIAWGHRWLAPTVGFFEVIIWVVAVREVLVNLRNVACVLAYGLGFAAGSFIGLWLEEKLSLGTVLVRLVLPREGNDLETFLRENDYGYTIVQGEGTRDKVRILFTIIRRKSLGHVFQAVSRFAPNAFYTVESVRSAEKGVFPVEEPSAFSSIFRMQRKSK